MDSTTKLINLARICMANEDDDKLKEISKSIDLDYLSGTVFDKNINLCLEEIDKIIFERQSIRRIKNISEESYRAVSKRKKIPILSEEFDITFDTIERNLETFNDKFKDKVFRIDSTDGSKNLVSIGVCNFFHLLGFSLNEWQKNKDSVLRLFPEFKSVLESDYREICITDNHILYEILYTLIDKKNNILEEIERGNKGVFNAFNMNKVKVKNFLFEKSDFTSFPSGIVNYKPKGGNIKGDLYLLRDHINNGELEWGALSFRAYDIAPPKKLESVLYSYFDNQDINRFYRNVTTSIGCVEKKDYLNNPVINEIPIITKFGINDVEYLKKILSGINPVVENIKVKKKQTK